MPDTAPATADTPVLKNQLDKDLRGWLATNRDIVTVIRKPVGIGQVPALIAQSHKPILFENIKEYPGFRLCDMLVRHRWSQCRALGVGEKQFLPTLAQRLRKAPRGFVDVKAAPVKEVIWTGDKIDLRKLPIPAHSQTLNQPYITAMGILKDPETGFCNTCNPGTAPIGPNKALMSFVTPHSHAILKK